MRPFHWRTMFNYITMFQYSGHNNMTEFGQYVPVYRYSICYDQVCQIDQNIIGNELHVSVYSAGPMSFHISVNSEHARGTFEDRREVTKVFGLKS